MKITQSLIVGTRLGQKMHSTPLMANLAQHVLRMGRESKPPSNLFLKDINIVDLPLGLCVSRLQTIPFELHKSQTDTLIGRVAILSCGFC